VFADRVIATLVILRFQLAHAAPFLMMYDLDLAVIVTAAGVAILAAVT